MLEDSEGDGADARSADVSRLFARGRDGRHLDRLIRKKLDTSDGPAQLQRVDRTTKPVRSVQAGQQSLRKQTRVLTSILAPSFSAKAWMAPVTVW